MIEVMNNAYAKGCRMLHDKANPAWCRRWSRGESWKSPRPASAIPTRSATACWRILGF